MHRGGLFADRAKASCMFKNNRCMNHTPPKPPSAIEPLEENIERLQRTGTPQRLKACEFLTTPKGYGPNNLDCSRWVRTDFNPLV